MDNISLIKKADRAKNKLSWILSMPALIWLLLFFMVPYLIVVIYSFLTPTLFDIKFEFSLDAYRQAFSPVYIRPFILSFRLAIFTTLLCILLGYPVAYYIAKCSPKVKNFLLLLIIIPFWTNFIIRIFSWRIFLSANGLLSSVLASIGVIGEPLRLMRTDFAVILVMVYVYLPYMILPLYASIEKIDFTLIQAAMDLGANKFQSFLKVTLPLSKEGILAGTILVFIPALGAYIVPQLVGNQDALYIGQIITYKIKDIPRNWPLASSLSLVLLFFVALFLLIFSRIYKKMTKKDYLL